MDDAYVFAIGAIVGVVGGIILYAKVPAFKKVVDAQVLARV